MSTVKYQGLSELEILEEAKNYNKWIVQQFIPHIKSPIIEIGSGTGNISKFFVNRKNTFLSDVDKGLVKNLQKKFKKSKYSILQLNIAGKINKKYINKFQSIIAINVMEHIEDDGKALKNMYHMLQKNGKVLLLVPAKRFAFSRLDKSLGHFRRYEKKEFAKKLEKAGFVIEKIYFFNIVGLLSWTVRDKIERGHHMKPWQIKLFDRIVPLLAVIENYVKPPVGISLIAIARKQ